MTIEKVKQKKGHPKRNKFLFIALWLIGHVLAWGALIPISPLLGEDSVNNLIGYAIIAMIIGGITSLTQYTLIRWQFGRNIKWWIPLSVVAWVFAATVPFRAATSIGSNYAPIEVTIQALTLYMPAALLQTFLLKYHVRQAWLWILGTIAGCALFALPINGSLLQVVVGYGLYASATALTLLWLFGMSMGEIRQAKDTSKNKENHYNRLHDADTIESSEYEYQGEPKEKARLDDF